MPHDNSIHELQGRSAAGDQARSGALSIGLIQNAASESVRLRDIVGNPVGLAGRSVMADVSPRVRRAFGLAGIDRWDDVLEMTVTDLLGVKYLSPRTVDEVLLVLSETCGSSIDPKSLETPAASGRPEPVPGTGADAVVGVARWVSIPEAVWLAVAMTSIYRQRGAQFMADRLDGWCPDIPDAELARAPSLAKDAIPFPGPVDEDLWRLATHGIFVEDGRSTNRVWSHVLASRVLVEGPPQTLAEVGDASGVTRERIRQIETTVRAQLRRELDGGRLAPLRQLACEVGLGLGEVATAAEVDARIRDAVAKTSNEPTAEEERLRRCLLRGLLGEYTQRGSVVIRPWLEQKIAGLDDGIRNAGRGVLLDRAAIDGSFERLGIGTEHRSALRDSLGLHAVKDWYVDWRVAQPDKAVAVLAAFGRPLTMHEIHNGVGFDVNPRSLAMRVQADPRIRRLGKDSYGLAAWGGEEYSGILDELEQAVERNGGSVDLDSTVDQFVELFGVSGLSVRSYANDRRFILEQGQLRFRTGDDPEVGYRRVPVELMPGMSQIDGVWHLRVEVSHDVLRGSGVPIRNAVAYEAGIEPDLTLGFDYGPALVTFYWGQHQPRLGSIRPLAEALGCVEGDYVFLPLAGSEPRAAHTVRRSELASHHGLGRLALELGTEPPEPDEVQAELLRALALPSGADMYAVADRLRDRGELELVALMPEEYR